MACKGGCGGGKKSLILNAPAFSTDSVIRNGDTIIAAKSTFLLKGRIEEILVRAGSFARVSSEAAADLINKGAPIWIQKVF